MNVTEKFASMVFDDRTMRERLSAQVYEKLKASVEAGAPLEQDVANHVAEAMKQWALEKGVTHYTHWFQPLNGVTAEKHDSFIQPDGRGGVIMEFSGKELIKGESDASSFPSGGLRSTFEARGYTAWDPSSFAFIKDDTLCIPTAFCSYGGEVLDQKTPLLRSMDAVNTQAMRILRLFGNTEVSRVTTEVGSEQEYFLIDKKMYDKREDLIFCGRTLYGAKPPKGQEMEDHYYGAIRARVADYMKDLHERLWELGILAKTEHNEVAPAQHEMAPIYSTTNIANDQNQLTMELMIKVAEKHGLVCLLHEKPFAGVNGSGKHNNWSLSTDTGEGLLKPGKKPEKNVRFLLFLAAVIKAVDEYQDLLRISVATAGNDHRLGASEAPPAVLSVFLGDELGAILEAIENEHEYERPERRLMDIGAAVLPHLPMDTTDRNRTSPMAFTGNKFEFRMPGSSQGIAACNTVINAAVAEALCQFADELEGAEDFNTALQKLIFETIKKHKRIIFNGNGYDEAWLREAETRGLSNLKSTPEALVHYTDEKNVALMEKHHILTQVELESRQEIMQENYCKVLNIEALTMLDMAKKQIVPGAADYTRSLAESIKIKKELGLPCEAEENLAKIMCARLDETARCVGALEKAVSGAKNNTSPRESSFYYHDSVLTAMDALRTAADSMEENMSEEYLRYPTYKDILFNI